jgi:hypothetical protein
VTPTQLTLRHLREEGWTLVEVVEHWNPHARLRQDLFGMIDVIAVRPNETMGIQTTSYSNVPARVRKIAEHPNTPHIREAGWTLRVHGWRKVKNRWTLARDVDVS